MLYCILENPILFSSILPQTGLALMGFSRYCPSSLDLPHFVVRECRGATAEPPRRSARAGPDGPSPARGQILEIWDLEIQKFGIPKFSKMKILKIQIRSAQNVGKVWISRKKSSWPHLAPFQVIFSMDCKNQEMPKFCLFSLVGPCCYPSLVGLLVLICFFLFYLG